MFRQRKVNRFVMCIDKDQKRIVANRIAKMVFFLDAVSSEANSQTADIALLPILFVSFLLHPDGTRRDP